MCFMTHYAAGHLYLMTLFMMFPFSFIFMHLLDSERICTDSLMLWSVWDFMDTLSECCDVVEQRAHVGGLSIPALCLAFIHERAEQITLCIDL